MKSHSAKFHAAKPLLGCRSAVRSGSVALMLMLILALLVGTFAVTVARRASSERRNELHHHRITVLQSAIDAVAEAGFESDTKIRLPLDTGSERWVIVESVVAADAEPQYQATLYHHDQPGISIRRLARNEP